MLFTTREIHNQVRALGESLGFTVTTEVSDSLLRLRLGEEAYRPHVDLLWSIPLATQERAAIAWALERDQVDVTHLPVVGIEVESTKPTTKTWVADATNLAALGVPLGLLIGSVHGEKDSYRRAARAIRSVRRSFGDIHLLPLEAAWLGPLIERPWPVGLSSIPPPKLTAPTGGETLAWSKATWAQLRALGEQAGFIVAEDYIPPVLAATFNQIVRQRANPLCHTYDPLGPTVKTMAKAKDLFTESKLDLAWLMPLPLGLPALLGRASSKATSKSFCVCMAVAPTIVMPSPCCNRSTKLLKPGSSASNSKSSSSGKSPSDTCWGDRTRRQSASGHNFCKLSATGRKTGGNFQSRNMSA